ncbi:RagB/SusD family nutrient uptake outer membrane protein [Dyadobacter chenwenxiniae]|uniref:RagB/SusD family nutrient uptake outer membrane protein n=1 Tax=Dyadobacter chenwenxiniae TaxID=2906456 RepID=A0A9X1PMU6_9BACT|nr:RagB/SusD family nutrient uptake outer membrane protein [Dyadobacter chenwenxiniae]MCF0050314.1 RagB/SusD family nutrient uptake outer membrane protein [Dyadobacter chenwenxiniae]MCF0064035.1 RagB/SusD family nutrient uptake outer membrane protein [Dyadobacter chenwenxiniae]UON82762.1 RagB/SusD family nutrient uptake outer membrane protein [Dyadobacter chenwenxiniae]
MKTNQIYKLLVTGVCMATLSACTDLVNEEKDSVVNKVVEGNFAPVNVPEALASAYKDLSTYSDQAGIYALGQHTTAEMIPPTRGVDWGDNGVWRTLDQHTWDASHSYILSAWNNLNQRAYKATEIIASNPTAVQKAQAQFLRAYNMHWVMDYWGSVPVREVTQGVNDLPKVLSRSEAFDYIVKDLEEALPNLPKKGPSVNNGTASKAAANFLLAKLYLNKAIYKGATPEGPYTFDKADMAKVVTYVDAVTADGYSLEKDYFSAFSSAAKTEPIFNVQEGTAQNRWMMTLHYGQNPSGWNGFATLADFYDTFEAKDTRIGKPAKKDGTQFSGISYGFLIGQQYDEKGKVIIDTRTQKPLQFTKDVPLAGAATDKGIRVIKYHPANAGKYLLMRYAEAYLMKAEALLRSGNAAGALTQINALRTMRGASALASLTDANLFDEIGRELYWEGGKRTTEIRFGKFTTGAGTSVKEAYTVLYPIPSAALVSNANLEQNPGY